MVPRGVVRGNGTVVPTISYVPSGFPPATVLPVYIMMQPNVWTSLETSASATARPTHEGWAELTTNTSTGNNTERS